MSTFLKSQPYFNFPLQNLLEAFTSFLNYKTLPSNIAKDKQRLFFGNFPKAKIPVKVILTLVLTGLLWGTTTFAQNLLGKPESSLGIPSSRQTRMYLTGALNGVILDVVTKQPITLASITLENTSTGKTVNVTDSDEKGKFSLSGLAAGQYRLFVTELNYGTTVIDGLLIKNEEVNIGNLTLISDANAFTQVLTNCEKD